MRPCSGVGKQAKIRLFMTQNEFGNNKKWQFWGCALPLDEKNSSCNLLIFEFFKRKITC